jgi:DNA-directed RNA polymerase specialized sigma24 family protein
MDVVDDNQDGDDVRELLRAARDGDEHALGCLLSPYWCSLKLFCGLMLGNADAADRAMAETIRAARAEIEFIDSPASARLWIHRIAARVCVRAVDDDPIQNDQPPQPHRHPSVSPRREGS